MESSQVSLLLKYAIIKQRSRLKIRIETPKLVNIMGKEEKEDGDQVLGQNTSSQEQTDKTLIKDCLCLFHLAPQK